MPDLVIEAYKADVDRTLLRENLKLTPQQRFDKFSGVMRNLMSLRAAGQRARQQRMTELSDNESPSMGSSAR
jgi:hypothetical protein